MSSRGSTTPIAPKNERDSTHKTGPAPLALIANSKPVEVFLTLIVFSIYAAVIAASVFPTVWFLVTLLPPILGPHVSAAPVAGAGSPVVAALLASAVVGAAFYVYLFGAAFVQSVCIRLLSLGLKPGKYPALSFTTLRWLIYGGITTISMRMLLPVIPVSFLINAYFRIVGCTIGRDVKINTPKISDAYLLTLEDGVVLGGGTDITCHLWENDHLILQPIVIGAGTLVGSNSYIAPGVTIGKRCVVGVFSYLRAGSRIPDNSVITSVGGVDTRTARDIERGRARTRP